MPSSNLRATEGADPAAKPRISYFEELSKSGGAWRSLAMVAVVGLLSFWGRPASGSTIYWGSIFNDTLLDSYANPLDAGFTFELGAFDPAFVPTAENMSSWQANWKVFDRAYTGRGWNVADQFLEGTVNHQSNSTSSYSGANPAHFFPEGTKAYLWVFNTMTLDSNTEWALLTDANTASNSLNDWIFPDPSLQTEDDLFDWQTRDLDTAIFGAVNGVQGDGVAHVLPSGAFTIQTHQVPEPAGALLVLAGLSLWGGWQRKRVSKTQANAVQTDFSSNIRKSWLPHRHVCGAGLSALLRLIFLCILPLSTALAQSDFGDYSGYGVAGNTANNVIWIGATSLGPVADAEASTAGNATATADDNTGDDENIVAPTFTAGSSSDVTIYLGGTAASWLNARARLYLFVDWNSNGVLDTSLSERSALTSITSIGSRSVSMPCPAGTVPGTYYMRARIQEDTPPAFTGTSANKGEVEDFPVTVACPTLVLAPATLPDAVIGDRYGQPLSVTGAGYAQTLNWSVVSGSLPDGLNLDPSSGELNGEAKDDGKGTSSYSFTVQATDQYGCSASANYTINLGTTGTGTMSIGNIVFHDVNDNGYLDPSEHGIPNVTLELWTPGPDGRVATADDVAVTSGRASDLDTASGSGTIMGNGTIKGGFSTLTATTDWNGNYMFTEIAPGTYFLKVIGKDREAFSSVFSGVSYSMNLDYPLASSVWFSDDDGADDDNNAVQSPGDFSNVFDLTHGGKGDAIFTMPFTLDPGTEPGPGRGSGDDEYTIDIGLRPCPVILLPDVLLPSATSGTAYSYTLTANGGVAPYSFARTSGTLPANIFLDASGLLHGTTTALGTYTFTVQATDSLGCTGIATMTLNVCASAITITNGSPLPTGTQGVLYSTTLAASGGTAPYQNWRVVSGSLPPGLSLEAGTGLLTGPPTSSGTYNFVIAVDDTSTLGTAVTLTNPSFETQNWNGIPFVPQTSVTGWTYGNPTLAGTSTNSQFYGIHNNVALYGNTAQGFQYVASPFVPSWLSQTVTGFTVGKPYNLRFRYALRDVFPDPPPPSPPPPFTGDPVSVAAYTATGYNPVFSTIRYTTPPPVAQNFDTWTTLDVPFVPPQSGMVFSFDMEGGAVDAIEITPTGAPSCTGTKAFALTINPAATTIDFGDVTGTGFTPIPSTTMTANLQLGAIAPDGETSQAGDATAMLDDNTGDDEDGILSSSLVKSVGGSLTVSLLNNTGSAKYLYGWVDLNANGALDAGEGATNNGLAVSSLASSQNINLNFPAPTASGSVKARVRISTINTATALSTGDGGEIEDHFVTISDQPPTVTTNAASAIGCTTVTLNGVVNPNGAATTAIFQYGTTVSYGSTATITLSPNNGTTNQSVTANLTGLLPNTTYHFRISATNSGGTSNGTNQTFTTLAGPSATTNAATAVTQTTATLNGVVNPNGNATTASFQYGTTLSYGSTAAITLSPNNGTTNQTVAANLTGLVANTLYHFRVTTTNACGTVNSSDMTFTTSGYTTDFGDVTGTGFTPIPSATITANLRLGSVAPDGEASQAGDATASLDDAVGDDEDGFVSTTLLNGSSGSVTIKVLNNTGSDKYLYGWVDLNGNGILDAGEKATNNSSTYVIVSTNSSEQNIALNFATATAAGPLKSRFRISTLTTATAVSTGDGGEIEDHLITLGTPTTDRGDWAHATNPAGAQTSSTSVTTSANLRMGATVDAEPSVTGNSTASVDDATGSDDENGILSFPALISEGGTELFTVNVLNTTGAAAKLNVFIDYNHDGAFNSAVFDPVSAPTGERVTAEITVPNNATAQDVAVSFPVPVTTNPGSQRGVRVTLTTASIADPTGNLGTGEIEDYVVGICPSDLIQPETLPSGVVGTPYSQTLSAVGGTAPFTWNASGAIPGLTFDTATATLSGTPTTAGTYNLRVSVDDSAGCRDSNNYTIIIDESGGGKECADPAAEDLGLGRRWGYIPSPNVIFDPGISVKKPFDDYGVLAGTSLRMIDSSSGTFRGISYKASCISTASRTHPSWGGSGRIFRDTSSGVPSGPIAITEGECSAYGCWNGAYNWSLSLNPAINVTPSGIYWENVIYNVTFTSVKVDGVTIASNVGPAASDTILTDAGAVSIYYYFVPYTGVLSAGSNHTIEVSAAPGVDPVFGDFALLGCCSCSSVSLAPAGPALSGATIGVPYSTTLTASGGATPYYYSVISGTLPTDLKMDPETGEIFGTPSVAGTFNFTVEARDANDCTASRAYSITVAGLSTDYGDLPDTGSGTGVANYRTLSSDSGPVHSILANLRLGTQLDGDANGQPNSTATGDGADEDGVTAWPVFKRSSTVSIPVSFFNNVGAAKIFTFIDWNNNGDFTDDAAVTAVNVSSSASQQSTSISVTVPAAASLTCVGLRMRLSTAATLGSTGSATDGEVEDYFISVIPSGNQQDYGDHLFGSIANSASNVASTVIQIGATYPDVEATDPSNSLSNADDNTGNDEDYDSFPSLPVGGVIGDSVNVTLCDAMPVASIGVWVDWNDDGDVNDANEIITFKNNLAPGVNSVPLSFTAPVGITAGLKYARIRVQQGSTLPTFAGVSTTLLGEVEDMNITVTAASHDRGDCSMLPEATATINSTLRLGVALTDADAAGNSNPTATGDDTIGTDDEDGVTMYTAYASGMTGQLTISVTNTTGAAAYLSGWIDFNNTPGTVEANEIIINNVTVATGATNLVQTYTVNVPAGITVPRQVCARFRISSVSGTGISGDGGNGEVEDYRVTIGPPQACAVTTVVKN